MRTYNTVISACNKSGQPEQALAVYEKMLAAGIKPSATTYTALISAYGKKGQVERALEVFQVRCPGGRQAWHRHRHRHRHCGASGSIAAMVDRPGMSSATCGAGCCCG